MDESNEGQTPLRRWARRVGWGFIVVLTALTFYWLPLGEYIWSVGRSVVGHGVSRQAWQELREHNAWLLRFFTGPPSDAEMVAFFRQHRQDMERLAYWHGTGRCTGGDCQKIGPRLGLYRGTLGWVANSAFRTQAHPPARFAQDIQEYSFNLRTQDWWRNTNSIIYGWDKAFVYIPPLLPGATFGLDDRYSTDRDKIMLLHCHYLKPSLDQPVPEIMAEKSYSDDCGHLPLGDGWYLTQRAYFHL